MYSATSETTPRSMRHQPVGFLALVVAHQQPALTAGQIGYVGAPLVEDQLEDARSRSQRLWRAATRELRLLISRATAQSRL